MYSAFCSPQAENDQNHKGTVTFLNGNQNYRRSLVKQGGGGNMQKKQDEALLAAFHLMDRDERAFFLATAQNHTKNRQAKPAPQLRLVAGGASAATESELRRRLR